VINHSATVDAENQAERITWPTYADRVEMGYKAFEIGLWELRRENHADARSWLRTAVDFGVEDARSLLAICVGARTSTPTVRPTARTPTPPPTARTALGAFASDFAARPAHVRLGALNWFPRRQLAILRSVAQLTIVARDLVRDLDRARVLDRDRLLARDVDRDPVLARNRAGELASTLAKASDRALDLKRALDRDRAGELASARDRASALARDLTRVRVHVLDHVLVSDVDRDIAHALDPVRDRALVHDLARVRDIALVHARDLALGRVIDPVRARHVALAHARSGDRDLDLDQALIRDVDRDIATALALDLASALDRDRDLDLDVNHEIFDRELIEAVKTLEKALSPSA
jgi:hypothetical protein